MAVFDQLARPDEAVELAAQVEPAEPPEQAVSMAGYPVYFEEQTTGLSSKAVSDRNGVATCTGPFPLAPGPVEVLAGYPGNRRQRGVQARGRVFVWPADTAFVLVDADHALTATDPEAFRTVNNIDVRALPDAAPTLRRLRETYPVGYVTGATRQPQLYNKLRAWLDNGWSPAQQFPAGPVLTTWGDGEADAAAARLGVLTALRGRFTGKGIGVAGNVETATQFQQQGLQTFLVGEAENVPEGVTRVKDWAALEKAVAR
jgi:hypothetical protein